MANPRGQRGDARACHRRSNEVREQPQEPADALDPHLGVGRAAVAAAWGWPLPQEDAAMCATTPPAHTPPPDAAPLAVVMGV